MKFKFKRKSQMKMAENIGILVIFFILLVVGMVFYARVQSAGVKFEAIEKRGQDALIISQRIVNLPEIQCSEPVESEAGRQDCIDLYRLMSFSDDFKFKAEIGDEVFNSYYFDIFTYSNVTLREIYPPSGREWELYSNKPAQISSRIPTPVPVLLFDEVQDKYSFGMLIVEVYS
ncbi:MAG: hypothetical protein U9R08_05465 [Nanoarchaeota archaeon]|nr:hypothetical protein [Nanoarchaeota archaeon]